MPLRLYPRKPLPFRRLRATSSYSHDRARRSRGRSCDNTTRTRSATTMMTNSSNELYGRLTLDGTGGETRDVVFHEERVDEGDGNGAQQRPGHELAPVEGVATDQLAHDAD